MLFSCIVSGWPYSGWRNRLVGPCRKLALFRCATVFCAMCACAAALRAQSLAPQEPQQDSTELQVWSGAGHSANGGTDGTVVWNAGVRYGWVLTNPHGPGILRGRF